MTVFCLATFKIGVAFLILCELKLLLFFKLFLVSIRPILVLPAGSNAEKFLVVNYNLVEGEPFVPL